MGRRRLADEGEELELDLCHLQTYGAVMKEFAIIAS